MNNVMNVINSIAIFCGANRGREPIFENAAIEFAKMCAEKNITLVYGGAHVGLMGVIADHALKHGGKVIGVLPTSLFETEIAHQRLTKLHIVDSMHERKALMSDYADAYIMMPGGAGTLDEFFEAFTWAQLGYHQKPCGILNINNYFHYLIQFLEHAVDNGFIRPEHKAMIKIEDTPQKLLQSFIQKQY